MSTAIDEAAGDPGWPELTKFLEHAGLAAGQLLSGPYTVTGLELDGKALVQDKSLRDQSVQPGSKLSAVVKIISAVHALAAGKRKKLLVDMGAQMAAEVRKELRSVLQKYDASVAALAFSTAARCSRTLGQ